MIELQEGVSVTHQRSSALGSLPLCRHWRRFAVWLAFFSYAASVVVVVVAKSIARDKDEVGGDGFEGEVGGLGDDGREGFAFCYFLEDVCVCVTVEILSPFYVMTQSDESCVQLLKRPRCSLNFVAGFPPARCPAADVDFVAPPPLAARRRGQQLHPAPHLEPQGLEWHALQGLHDEIRTSTEY